MTSISPLAPRTRAAVLPVSGVQLKTMQTDQRYRGRPDLLVVLLDEGTEVAGCFTRSHCPSAAVDWCREQLAKDGAIRAILVNAGNANAFTGALGSKACEVMAGDLASALKIGPDSVLLASTGVIGEPLDGAHYKPFLSQCEAGGMEDGFWSAAEAIMTTDTFPKAASRTVVLGGQEVTLSGIAKGSGMIAPDMATMLSFVFTDAPMDHSALQAALSQAVEASFNRVTVDSDTSTSDTVLMAATGRADIPPIQSLGDPRFAELTSALCALMIELAQLVVKDGEGASKFIAVRVSGAASSESAKKIAMSVANSPLVKTAVAGEDANWGRVVMAIGKAGERANRDLIKISFGPHLLAEEGARVADYSEEKVSAYMKSSDIEISVDLGLGSGAAEVWTCDLTHGYIDINADYRS